MKTASGQSQTPRAGSEGLDPEEILRAALQPEGKGSCECDKTLYKGKSMVCFARPTLFWSNPIPIAMLELFQPGRVCGGH